MNALVIAIHLLACLILVAVVLLQHGKGADIGSAFGGGASQTVFGGRGAGNFLTKLTAGAAVAFMLTSLTLSYFTAPTSLIDELADEEEQSAPAPESAFPEAPPIPEGAGDAPKGFEATPAEGRSAPAPAPAPAPTEAPKPEGAPSGG
ncbi:MAG: preprotein translocase subunit SecG [Candidatus Rokuibacteriota bacterium]